MSTVKIICEQIGQPKIIGELLETYNFLSLNHEKVEHLNRPVTSRKIESVI